MKIEPLKKMRMECIWYSLYGQYSSIFECILSVKQTPALATPQALLPGMHGFPGLGQPLQTPQQTLGGTYFWLRIFRKSFLPKQLTPAFEHKVFRSCYFYKISDNFLIFLECSRKLNKIDKINIWLTTLVAIFQK